MKSIGLLVTSDRYAHYAIALVRAAHAKGVAVQVLLTRSARQLVYRPEFAELVQTAKIITGKGAGSPIAAKDDDRMPGRRQSIDPEQWAGFFEGCDRHIVL
ncbi:MAG: hypothetical protein PVH87_05130 [Desulfobacteraceae bacterium]|jgi:hypothetical protein